MVHKRKYLKTFTRAGKYTGLLHTKMQLKKMTKAGLIRLVIKLEKFIVSHAYEMYKAKLPRLRTTRQNLIPFTINPYGKVETQTRKQIQQDTLIPTAVSRRRTAKGYKDFEKHMEEISKKKRKTKRKKLTGAAKAKFLARMNKGRRKKGLKPIRSR